MVPVLLSAVCEQGAQQRHGREVNNPYMKGEAKATLTEQKRTFIMNLSSLLHLSPLPAYICCLANAILDMQQASTWLHE